MIFSLGCAAQSNIPSNARDILKSKNWIIQGVENHTYKIVFTSTEMLTYSNGVLIGKDKYYFVDKLELCGPGKFFESQVGSTNSGKFMIFKDFCLELMELSNNKWEFKNLTLNLNMLATPE